MRPEPVFRHDLYRGTARYYDRFRVPYPPVLLDDLRERAGIAGRGRLLDLACGTGQIALPLSPYFAEVWAVDQEPDMIEFATAKAERENVTNIRWLVCNAESVEAGDFDLITIGNAFHRLRRRSVAETALRWLVPGGHVALLWSDTPWLGSSDWQTVMATTLREWQETAGVNDRVPPGLDEALAEEPSMTVLGRAGFQPIGKFSFPILHDWTIEDLAGCVYSTSFLSLAALGEHAHVFEDDLRRRLLECKADGVFSQTIDFAYELARRPLVGP